MTFGSLYTARTGLWAARRALDIVGQNIANANTSGYTRQEVSFTAAEPAHVINSPGRGIAESIILRYRDEFLDRTYRSRAGMQGYHNARSQHLTQVEEIIGDLSEGGLRTALDEFFGSWDNLATNPTLPAARTQVISATEEFLSQARQAFQELGQLRSNVNQQIEIKVSELNKAARELAELNQAIMAGEGKGPHGNQLFDRRDLLLDSMARLGGVTGVRHDDGTVTVHVGSLALVERNVAHTIDAKPFLDATTDPLTGVQSTPMTLTSLTWNGTSEPVVFPSGELAGLVQVRDGTIRDSMEALDMLVRTVATEVNSLHPAQDLDGDGIVDPATENFFVIGAEWMDIQLNGRIKSDPSLIVAAKPPSTAPGDGEGARAIARLRDKAMMTGGPVGSSFVTPGEFLQSVSTAVGLQVQEATRRAEGAELQVAQAEKHRQSVSGVSIDDEMTKMIQFQQAYNAAARVMTAIDEMLDVMVNRIGLAGR